MARFQFELWHLLLMIPLGILIIILGYALIKDIINNIKNPPSDGYF